MSERLWPIVICHRRTSVARLLATDASLQIVDVTSKAEEPWRRFSPFYPHGNIPIPFWPERKGQSVEGIWQGLKRFEYEDSIDPTCFDNRTMKGLKRTSRAMGKLGLPRGRVLGHQAGERASVLLDYLQARALIYLPSYRWVLDNCLTEELVALRALAAKGKLALLDFNTNDDVLRVAQPLSHASLIRAFLNDAWPSPDVSLPEGLLEI